MYGLNPLMANQMQQNVQNQSQTDQFNTAGYNIENFNSGDFVMQPENLFNNNGKRSYPNECYSSDISMSTFKTEGSTPFAKIAQNKPIRSKKPKINKTKLPVYKPGCLPQQVLHEIHPNLVYKIEADETNKRRFICETTVQLGDGREATFSGDGASKKDAKRKCCHFVLINLYSYSYQPPPEVLVEYDQPTVIEAVNSQTNIEQETDPFKIQLNEVKKRIDKILNKSSIQFKSPSQLLHELSVKVANTGKCISESGQMHTKMFTFRFVNALAGDDLEALSHIPEHAAYGTGKNKKDAKSAAAKQALKQFFNFDTDKIFEFVHLKTQTEQLIQSIQNQPNQVDPAKLQNENSS